VALHINWIRPATEQQLERGKLDRFQLRRQQQRFKQQRYYYVTRGQFVLPPE
jgi:hypothetical protein